MSFGNAASKSRSGSVPSPEPPKAGVSKDGLEHGPWFETRSFAALLTMRAGVAPLRPRRDNPSSPTLHFGNVPGCFVLCYAGNKSPPPQGAAVTRGDA